MFKCVSRLKYCRLNLKSILKTKLLMVMYLPSTKSTNQCPYLHGQIMIIFIDRIIYTHKVNVKGGGTREAYILLWTKSCNTNTCTKIQDIIYFVVDTPHFVVCLCLLYVNLLILRLDLYPKTTTILNSTIIQCNVCSPWT